LLTVNNGRNRLNNNIFKYHSEEYGY